MAKRSNEPFLWLLFSAGGVVAALLIPVHLFLFGIAFPLGWLNAPTYDAIMALIRSPLGRLYLWHYARYRFSIGPIAFATRFTTVCRSNISTSW